MFEDDSKTTNINFYFQWVLEKEQIQNYIKTNSYWNFEVLMTDFKLL